MREALDQWDFVLAAYALGVGGTLAMVAWAWRAMTRAERRRDLGREQGREP
jgi:cytochrome c biogenesis protein CcdA